MSSCGGDDGRRKRGLTCSCCLAAGREEASAGVGVGGAGDARLRGDGVWRCIEGCTGKTWAAGECREVEEEGMDGGRAIARGCIGRADNMIGSAQRRGRPRDVVVEGGRLGRWETSGRMVVVVDEKEEGEEGEERERAAADSYRSSVSGSQRDVGQSLARG